jgi:serine/threonine-protein kinase PpkA
MNIPGFNIGPILGEGGMATVYLAEQVSLGRQVALKIMSPTLVVSDSGFCERFINEGRIIAKLRHQHIVTIHDIGCADDQHYFMAMEYCTGGTLKQRIADGTSRLQPVTWIRQIASALGYAHDHGFIHRDIKPGNVLFRDDGMAVLSDFGIAKTVGSRTRVTQEGWAIGTPEYMSPEQAAGSDLSPSSDLYSLGVVLYEMLTGRKPFSGPDALSIAMQHASAPIPRLPSDYLWLQHVVDGLMAKRAADRYESADALITELDAVERARPKPRDEDATRFLSPVSAGDAANIPRLPVQGRPGHTAWIIGLVGATVIVAAGAAWLLPKIPLMSNDPAHGDQATVSIDRPDDAPSPSPDTLTPEVADRVNRLLDVAQMHMAVGRSCGPVGSNAYEAYALVVEIDPRNQEARSALRRLEAACPSD